MRACSWFRRFWTRSLTGNYRAPTPLSRVFEVVEDRSSWLSALRTGWFDHSSGNIRSSRRPGLLFQSEFAQLEDRVTPAVTNLNAGILTIQFDATDEAVTLANDGTEITITSNKAITGGVLFDTDDVTRIEVNEIGSLTGQQLTVGGSAAFMLVDGFISAGVETVVFDRAVNAGGGSGLLNVNATTRIEVNANLTGGSSGLMLVGGGSSTGDTDGVIIDGATVTTTGNGNVSVTGTGGSGSGSANYGVLVLNAGQITAGGNGTVTVEGIGGSSTGNNHFGVYVIHTNSRITSGGGHVSVTGQGGGTGTSGGNFGVYLNVEGEITSGGSGTVSVTGIGGGGTGGSNVGVVLQAIGKITSGNNADITITADSQALVSTSGGINSGTGTTTIRPRTAGTRINLGGPNILSGSPLTLGFDSDDLNRA